MARSLKSALKSPWRRTRLTRSLASEAGLQPAAQTKAAHRKLLMESTAAMAAATRSREWQRSLSLFAEFDLAEPRVRPDIALVNAAVSACEAGRCWPDALLLLGDASRRLGCRPNLVTYTAAISACHKGQQWRQALHLFAGLGARRLAPDNSAIGAAISACAKGRRWQLALQALQEARGASLQPNAVVYNATISACEKARQWEGALALLQGMVHVAKLRPTLVTLNTALSACEMARQWERALQIAEADFAQAKLEPDLVSLNVVIGALGAGQYWQQALSIFHGLAARGFKATNTTHTTTISACERASMWEEALRVLFLAPTLDAGSYDIATVACARANRWAKALDLLTSLRQGRGQPDEISVGAVMWACELSGVGASLENSLAACMLSPRSSMRRADKLPLSMVVGPSAAAAAAAARTDLEESRSRMLP
ncbi:unnamed protein product [Polarella glacialis]|uniref:Pentatricopeptide repeat-containing protein, chloroplastic n=1 Tax=Polarella glacialis TaxID=89957 RepID=A0A813JED9_POLGL|nr:unnamed protein product [Polarella glacialis]